MYIKYSFYTLVFSITSILSACENPVLVTSALSNPSLEIEFLDLKKRIVAAVKIPELRSDTHFLTLQDGSDIQHIEFIGNNGVKNYRY